MHTRVAREMLYENELKIMAKAGMMKINEEEEEKKNQPGTQKLYCVHGNATLVVFFSQSFYIHSKQENLLFISMLYSIHNHNRNTLHTCEFRN